MTNPILPRPVTPHTIPQCAAVVASVFNVAVAEMRNCTQERRITDARHLAMYLAAECGYSTSAVGRYFRRDHSTAHHAINRVALLAAESTTVRMSVERLRMRLAGESDEERGEEETLP